jgi:DNA damage-binding protein 1
MANDDAGMAIQFVLALNIATRGDFIVVGDLMRSMSLIRYNAMPVCSCTVEDTAANDRDHDNLYDAQETLEEIARDFNPLWLTSVQVLDDETFLAADNNFNVVTLRKNSEATSEEERCRLDTGIPGTRTHACTHGVWVIH